MTRSVTGELALFAISKIIHRGPQKKESKKFMKERNFFCFIFPLSPWVEVDTLFTVHIDSGIGSMTMMTSCLSEVQVEKALLTHCFKGNAGLADRGNAPVYFSLIYLSKLLFSIV